MSKVPIRHRVVESSARVCWLNRRAPLACAVASRSSNSDRRLGRRVVAINAPATRPSDTVAASAGDPGAEEQPIVIEERRLARRLESLVRDFDAPLRAAEWTARRRIGHSS